MKLHRCVHASLLGWNKRRAMLASLFGLTLICIIWFVGREPAYRGRTLSTWLAQCRDTPLMEEATLAEAQNAVRAIGAARTLTRLLEMAQTRDGRLRSWIIATGTEREIPVLRDMRSAERVQLLAISGFEALGTEGAPAVGALTRLLEEPHCAFTAFQCLEGIGQPAERALSQCLTNRDWNFRYHAVRALQGIKEDVEDYIACVKDRLKDSEESVRFVTVQAIGEQADVPEIAVPLLIESLMDNAGPVVSQAAEALARFGTNATGALAALTEVAEKRRDSTAGRALRAMLSIAPEQALPVLLRHIKSPEAYRRRVAAALFADCPADNSTVTEALEAALADDDPHVVRLANRSLSKRRTGTAPAVGLSTLHSLVAPESK